MLSLKKMLIPKDTLSILSLICRATGTLASDSFVAEIKPLPSHHLKHSRVKFLHVATGDLGVL